LQVATDTLHAALGLSWMIVYAPDEASPLLWPAYARDVFLVDGARLFGVALRDVHPPEAARGVAVAPEFVQHFEASYRPFIQTALANRQAVLAWGGWPGDAGRSWGMLEPAEYRPDTLVGFVPFGSESVDAAQRGIALVAPPAQLYVVERLAPRLPDTRDLLARVLRNTASALSNRFVDRFGVISGSVAVEQWGKELSRNESGGEMFRKALQSVVHSAVNGIESGLRFIRLHRPGASPEVRAGLSALENASHEMLAGLRAALCALAGELSQSESESVRAACAALEVVRSHLHAVSGALAPFGR